MDAGGDGGGPPLAFTTADGNSGCSPGPEVHFGLEVAGGTNCSTAPAGPYATCQQDFRCIASTGRCEWNGTEGYYDPAVVGADITIGVTCDDGSLERTPICNRGSAAVPGGTTINIYNVGSSPAADSCAVVGAPFCTSTLPATGLGPGKCISVPCNVPGNKYFVVKASPDPENATTCRNNQAFAKNSGSCASCVSCNTRISGKVFDPSAGLPALANPGDLPIAGVRVFQPTSTPLPAFVDGVACDSCATLNSPAIAEAVTGADGSFVINNATPGTSIPLVVQSGRWRRTTTVNVTACGANPQVDGTVRFPRSRTDGLGGQADIPKMAVVTGSLESHECLFYKLGLRTEIDRYSAAAPERVHLFRDNGMSTAPGGAIPAVAGLLGTPATLANYSAVIYDCTAGGYVGTTSATERGNIRAWADLGGRVFVDHVPGEALIRFGGGTWGTAMGAGPAPSGGYPSGRPAEGFMPTGTPSQDLLRNWMVAVGASAPGLGWVMVDEPKEHAITPGPATIRWINGHNSNGWTPATAPPSPGTNPNYTLSFSFETPYQGAADCGTANGHGLVIYNGMHVYPGRKSGNSFPGNCNLATGITPEEKALIYQLFQLTNCQVGGSPPPPLPPTLTFTRDFVGVCGPGEAPVWTQFYWQTNTPGLSRIEFYAATSDSAATLPATAPPPPGPVLFATALGSAVLPPLWATNTPTIDVQLRTGATPPGPSKPILRIYMKFIPDGLNAPSLLGWNAQFSCQPAE